MGRHAALLNKPTYSILVYHIVLTLTNDPIFFVLAQTLYD
jgi:hypothetical protein